MEAVSGSNARVHVGQLRGYQVQLTVTTWHYYLRAASQMASSIMQFATAISTADDLGCQAIGCCFGRRIIRASFWDPYY